MALVFWAMKRATSPQKPGFFLHLQLSTFLLNCFFNFLIVNILKNKFQFDHRIVSIWSCNHGSFSRCQQVALRLNKRRSDQSTGLSATASDHQVRTTASPLAVVLGHHLSVLTPGHSNGVLSSTSRTKRPSQTSCQCSDWIQPVPIVLVVIWFASIIRICIGLSYFTGHCLLLVTFGMKLCAKRGLIQIDLIY